MITRLFARQCWLFSTTGTRVVSGKVYAELPEVKLPTKPKPEE